MAMLDDNTRSGSRSKYRAMESRDAGFDGVGRFDLAAMICDGDDAIGEAIAERLQLCGETRARVIDRQFHGEEFPMEEVGALALPV